MLKSKQPRSRPGRALGAHLQRRRHGRASADRRTGPPSSSAPCTLDRPVRAVPPVRSCAARPRTSSYANAHTAQQQSAAVPRAVVEAIVRQLERGEVRALEAIDAMLAEEFTLRESRRIKTSLVMARLSTLGRSPASTLPSSPRSTATGSSLWPS